MSVSNGTHRMQTVGLMQCVRDSWQPESSTNLGEGVFFQWIVKPSN
jgi:hypothetical protein